MRASLKNLVAAAALYALGPAAPGYGAGWRLANPQLLPDETLDRLAQRYGDIRNAQDLENLLADVGRRRQLTHLEARLVGGVWVLTGDPAVLVDDIDIDMVTRLLKTSVHATVQSFIGRVDSPELRTKVQDTILKYMKRRGYPESILTLKLENSDAGVVYHVQVNEGDPCIVGRVVLAFKLPPDTQLGVNHGDLCDIDEIEARINDLEGELRAHGYNQLKLTLDGLTYDHGRDIAVVHVGGVLGQKVRYEIVDTAKRFLIDDLFADEELTKVDPTIVGPDAMAAELARRYKYRGFADVVVRGPEVKKAADDEFVYVYYVDPGKQYFLKNVQFEGVTVFKDEELLDAMGLKNFWQTSHPLNYDELLGGLTAVRARYQQAGYWDAKVRDPGIQKDKETGTVRLTVQVEEGRPRELAGVEVHGNNFKPAAEIRALLRTQTGQPLDRSKLVDFQQAVRADYIAHGYLYADVQLSLKAVAERRRIPVDVVVTVNEGRRVKIGDISVTGLTRTHEKVVRRELLFARGDWYDPEKINRSRQALTRLGLFRSVQIVPADRSAVADKEAEIDLAVDVREGKAGNVSFGPGWSYLKGWNWGAEASYNNIGGVGRQASIRGSISEEADQYAIGNKTLLGRKIGTGYLEPFLLDLPVDLSLTANQNAEWGGYLWNLSEGGEAALIHRLTLLPGSSVSAFYGQKIARTEGSTERELDQVASNVRIGQAGVRLSLDRRDNVKFPTSGYTVDSELAWARYGLGGDLRYFRWDIGSSVYFGLLDNVVLAFGVDLTSYDGIDRKGSQIGILPPSERLYSGGVETVRGYPQRSLGPVVRTPTFSEHTETVGSNQVKVCDVGYTTAPLDGSSRSTIKTELRYRITDAFAVTGFADNGNVFLSNDQMRKFQQAYSEPVTPPADAPDSCRGVTGQRSVEDNFSYQYADLLKNPGYLWNRHYFSYGLSLNLLTAIGAVNLAYGLPWREPKSDACEADPAHCNPRGKQATYWWARGEFHLNVGARF